MTQTNITTTHNYQQLSESERGSIQAFYEDHHSIREIAKRLHRNPSTISREIKRGTVRQLNADYFTVLSLLCRCWPSYLPETSR